MPDQQPVGPLLELLGSVVRDHDVHQHGRTSVVSCLIPNLPWAIDTITSVARAAGGTVLNTSQTRSGLDLPAEQVDFRAPVPGKTQAVLAASVEQATRYTRGGVEVAVALRATDGLVDAVYTESATSSFPLPSSSDPLLAVVRALSSERLALQLNGLVVIVYDESEFDAQQLELLWRIRGVLDGLELGPRTIVFMIASENPYHPTYIAHSGGARFALNDDRLRTRHPRSSLPADVDQILTGDPAFIGMFLGAGFSASSRLSLGNTLRDDAIRRLRLSPPEAASTQLAIDWYRHIAQDNALLPVERGRPIEDLAASLTLERVLRHEFRVYEGALSPTLQAFRLDCDRALTRMGRAPLDLANLIRSGRRLVICTVNFDALVETAAAGHCRRFATDAEFEQAPEYLIDYLEGRQEQVPLLKLHGTIEDIPSCIATDDRTLIGLAPSKQRAMEAILEQAASGTRPPWLYIGASMRDTDLDRFWSRTEVADGFREYWVSPYPEASIETFMHEHREERWNANRARPIDQHFITETADSFMQELLAESTKSSPQ